MASLVERTNDILQFVSSFVGWRYYIYDVAELKDIVFDYGHTPMIGLESIYAPSKQSTVLRAFRALIGTKAQLCKRTSEVFVENHFYGYEHLPDVAAVFNVCSKLFPVTYLMYDNRDLREGAVKLHLSNLCRYKRPENEFDPEYFKMTTKFNLYTNILYDKIWIPDMSMVFFKTLLTMDDNELSVAQGSSVNHKNLPKTISEREWEAIQTSVWVANYVLKNELNEYSSYKGSFKKCNYLIYEFQVRESQMDKRIQFATKKHASIALYLTNKFYPIFEMEYRKQHVPNNKRTIDGCSTDITCVELLNEVASTSTPPSFTVTSPKPLTYEQTIEKLGLNQPMIIRNDNRKIIVHTMNTVLHVRTLLGNDVEFRNDQRLYKPLVMSFVKKKCVTGSFYSKTSEYEKYTPVTFNFNIHGDITVVRTQICGLINRSNERCYIQNKIVCSNVCTVSDNYLHGIATTNLHRQKAINDDNQLTWKIQNFPATHTIAKNTSENEPLNNDDVDFLICHREATLTCAIKGDKLRNAITNYVNNLYKLEEIDHRLNSIVFDIEDVTNGIASTFMVGIVKLMYFKNDLNFDYNIFDTFAKREPFDATKPYIFSHRHVIACCRAITTNSMYNFDNTKQTAAENTSIKSKKYDTIYEPPTVKRSLFFNEYKAKCPDIGTKNMCKIYKSRGRFSLDKLLVCSDKAFYDRRTKDLLNAMKTKYENVPGFEETIECLDLFLKHMK